MLQLRQWVRWGIVRTSRRRGSVAVRAELGDAHRSRESSYSFRPFAHSRGYGESMSDWITMRRFHESKGVDDWRVVGEGACACFRTGSFAAGTRLVNAISELAGLEDHPPDVDLRHEGVIVRLVTVAADYYGLSERDLELARKISAIARKLGVPADPAMVETVLITIDAFDIPQVKPFLARRAWIPGPRGQPRGPGRSTRPRAVNLVPEDRHARPAGHPDPPRHLGA